MSEQLLSALLDGECTPGEVKLLLEQLEQVPALRQRWSRMCLVREAAESTRVPKASVDFCAGVMAAVAQEPVAQSRAGRVSAAVPSRSTRSSEMPLPRRASARRWQPVAGLAMAASIAAVVTVGGYRWLSQPVAAPAVVAAASAVNPSAPAGGFAQVQPVSFSLGPQGQLLPVSDMANGMDPVETRWSQLDVDTVSQLSKDMMEHGNMRAEQGIDNALSDPRLVRTVEYSGANGPH